MNQRGALTFLRSLSFSSEGPLILTFSHGEKGPEE